jgi:hypothetical protein
MQLNIGGAAGLDLLLLALVSLVVFADFITLSSRKNVTFIRGVA